MPSKIEKSMNMHAIFITNVIGNILSEEQIMESMSAWEEIVKNNSVKKPMSAMQHYKTDDANKTRVKEQCDAEGIRPTYKVVNERLGLEWKNMSKEEKEKWEEKKTNNATKTGPVKPASAYVLFGMKIRGSVVAENPDLPSKEITALIRGRWKNMSADEKKQYEDIAIEEKNKYLLKLGKEIFEKENPTEKWENVSDVTQWTQKAEVKTVKPKKEITPFDRYVKKMKKVDATANKKNLLSKWDELTDDEKKQYEKTRRTKKVQNTYSCGPDTSAPKRPMNAFMLFAKDKREEFKSKNPNLKAKDISKLFGSMWKNMSDEEKMPYTQMAQKHKEEYNALVGATTTSSKPKSTRSKTPDGFAFYKKKVLSEFKKKFPNLKGKELTAKIREMGWDNISDEQRNAYLNMALKAPPRRKNTKPETKTAFELYLESESQRLEVPITIGFRKAVRADWSAMDKNYEDKKYFKNMAKAMAEELKSKSSEEKPVADEEDDNNSIAEEENDNIVTAEQEDNKTVAEEDDNNMAEDEDDDSSICLGDDEGYEHDDDVIPLYDIDLTKIHSLGQFMLEKFPERFGNVLGPVCKNPVELSKKVEAVLNGMPYNAREIYIGMHGKYAVKEILKQDPSNKFILMYACNFSEIEVSDPQFFKCVKFAMNYAKQRDFPVCHTYHQEHECFCGMTVTNANKCAFHNTKVSLQQKLVDNISSSCK